MKTNEKLKDPIKLRYEKETLIGIVLGSFPFVLYLIAVSLASFSTFLSFPPAEQGERLVNVFVSLMILVYMSVYISGWLFGFPRWWFPYILFIFLFAAFLSNSSTPGLILFGYESGHQLWGWRAWLPITIATGIAILISIGKKPFHQLIHSLRHDPTRISFAFYGLLPFLYLIFFDEVNSNFETPFLFFNGIILSVIAIFFLNQSDPLKRLIWLYGGSSFVWLVNTIALSYYWHGRMEFWMDSPENWMNQFQGMAIFHAAFSFCVLVPVWMIDFFRSSRLNKKINL